MKDNMYYRNRIKQLLIMTVSFALILVPGCTASAEKSVQEEETTVQKELVEASTDLPQLITVTVGDIKKSEYYDGEINPSMQVLQFPRRGTFLEYRVLLGDTVEEGQVVAVTQPEYEQQIEDLEEKIEDLKTNYNNAVTNYDLELKTNAWRAGQLREVIEMMDPDMEGFDDICISFEVILSEGEKVKVQKKQYMEKAEKEIAFQEEKLARLQAKNKSNIITAPEHGTITYLADLKVGDNVGINSYPIVLADTEKCMIQCEYITEGKMERMKFSYAVKDGKQYELQYVPYEDGEYQRKNAKGEGVYTFFEVVNADESISFGEDIKVITVEEYRENVLVIPTDCIHRKEGKTFVYRDNNGNKESVFIEIGIADDFNTEVVAGLQEGDKLYASN